MNVNNKKIIVNTKKGNTHTFIFDDCISGMRKHIKPDSIDVVVTSPPYNLGVNYGVYNDKTPREDYLRWLDNWALSIKEALSEKGSFFLNMGSKPSDPWVPFEVIFVMRKHFELQNVIHWIKSIYIKQTSYKEPIEVNVGHYKPINSKRFVNDMHEYIFHLTKSGNVQIDRHSIGVPYKDQTNTHRWHNASTGIKCRGNVWYIPYKTIQDRSQDRPHPASYPPELAEMCVKLHGIDNTKIVLDPFLGIGNSAIGCLNLPVDFIGFEIDPEYYETAMKRIQIKQEFGQCYYKART